MTDAADMVNENQPTSVELVMEEMKPLRRSVADVNVEIKDGEASKSEQSCGAFM